RTIQVRAITQSSGTFPLNVRLFTPSGTLISDSQLTIRSTAYNVVALSITAAAGVFILAWWTVGWLRRKQRGDRAAVEREVEQEPDPGRPEETEGEIPSSEAAGPEPAETSTGDAAQPAETPDAAAGEPAEPAPDVDAADEEAAAAPGGEGAGEDFLGETVPGEGSRPGGTAPEPAAKRLPPSGQPSPAG
ncbi:MAG TPA: hypothetical protein VHL54_06960, partial [Actinomycetota bacterium]|nr:hypothetical protein [Actinomycetota bacterium]